MSCALTMQVPDPLDEGRLYGPEGGRRREEEEEEEETQGALLRRWRRR